MDFKRVMVELLWVAVGLLAVVMALRLWLWFYPQTFYREKPTGLCDGLLDKRPNWVSSEVEASDAHYVARLPTVPIEGLKQCIRQIDPKTYVVWVDGQLEGFRRTAFFGFTDWFCITSEGGVTSSATLGYHDLGSNHRWVARLRRQILSFRAGSA